MSMLRSYINSATTRLGDSSAELMRPVILVDRLGSEQNTNAMIHVTTSHFIIRADNGAKEIWTVNALVSTVERSPTPNGSTRLTIRCKHFQSLALIVAKEKDANDIYDVLTARGRIYNISEAFAFSHQDVNCDKTRGWSRLDWLEEFARQGVSNEWSLSDFNADYKACDTYPEKLWFPSTATQQVLAGSCKFRSRSRLPALTYFYKATSAAICRCAQPLSGFNARCAEDENLIEAIRTTNTSVDCLYIVDTRPYINAMANRMQGKGSEDMRNYANAQKYTFDVENIHAMRNSQSKLLEACQKQQLSVTDFIKAVDSSGWLRHLKAIYDCGEFVAKSVADGISCVVHCSDGWDRTAQTVSIAQLILDPYYRTIDGFEVLIDKDWCGFGYKFDDRCAHVSAPNDEHLKEVSPTFGQFLDVVYQVMRHEPLAFEFNERFLLELNEHTHSCLYGTFVGNCDKDRKDLDVPARTRSFWRHVDRHIVAYTNPYYTANTSLDKLEMPHTAFVVWSSMYNRFDTGLQPREYAADIPVAMKQHVDLLEAALMDEGKSVSATPVRWQTLLGCNECSSQACRREFISRFEHRLHCYGCGLVFCTRCMSAATSTTALCITCAAEK